MAIQPQNASGPRRNAGDLAWLPSDANWTAQLKQLDSNASPTAVWSGLSALANTRMDFIRTARLDRSLQKVFSTEAPPGLATKPVRLAVLGSSTLAHLLPSIRVAALRRGIWLTTYEPDYGQYLQELSNPNSGLHNFKPTTILFAFDTPHLLRGIDPAANAVEADSLFSGVAAQVREYWRLARETFRCQILHQTLLPVLPPLLGSNEHRLPGSRHHMISRLNTALRVFADIDHVDLLAIDARVAVDGLAFWHDPTVWHHAKQEIFPAAAPLYGDLLARLLAAQQGQSKKCLVLDLDNTLWGGVIGDDGLDNIVLGNGSALGEAFLAFQCYVADLAKRGIILAVCSKNEEFNALEPFLKHPEMVLKRTDIACFVANWTDKATNIRAIAQRLNIGLDSMVFVDDNPFERNLVRKELPMVAVPEIPEDPALYAACIADAGYFESLVVTLEDRERAAQYQANNAREALGATATDLPSYLRSLEMRLHWSRFDQIGLQRSVQLINKTNQFNLTTRRYTEEDVCAMMDDSRAFGLQFRLLDRFGDNGIVAIVIGRLVQDSDFYLDTWLMSCRVLGRQVEEATLSVVAEQARRLGAQRLIGEYRPSAKNAMVKDHYKKMGFYNLETNPDGTSLAALDLPSFVATDIFMKIIAA